MNHHDEGGRLTNQNEAIVLLTAVVTFDAKLLFHVSNLVLATFHLKYHYYEYKKEAKKAQVRPSNDIMNADLNRRV